MNFKLRISSIDDTAVATHCTLKICNNGDCENQGKTCTVTIPASNGYFSKDKNGDGNKEKKEIHKMKRQNNKRRKICPSDIISFNHSSSDLPTAFVYVENTKKVYSYVSIYLIYAYFSPHRKYCLLSLT